MCSAKGENRVKDSDWSGPVCCEESCIKAIPGCHSRGISRYQNKIARLQRDTTRQTHKSRV